jgi:tape measure domain-containing protein
MTDALIIPVDSSQVERGKRSLADLAAQSKKTEQSVDGLGRTGKSTGNSIGNIAIGARNAALGIVGVAAGVLALGNSLLKTSIGAEKLNNTLKFSTGSASAAAKELEFLRQATDKLGLEFESTASAYAKFSAAAKGTNLEGQQTRDIFLSVAKASTVLGLSADETSGALKAIEQIISKGTVSAEELRGQLGERLPGAFEIAARAMGVTTQELGKMLEQGQLVSDEFLPKFARELTRTLGDSPDSAAGSAQAQLNRLSNAWLDFKKVIAESGVINVVVNVVEGTTGALKFLTTGLSDISGNKNYQKTKLLQLLELRDQKNFRFFSEEQLNKDIAKLREALGITQQFKRQQNPATGDTSQSLTAPNFNVTKKDGEGGYDPQSNVNPSDIRRANDAYKREKERAEELARKKLDTEQKLYDIKDSFDKQLRERELKHLDLVEKEQERVAKDKAETAQKYFEFEEKKRKEIEQEQERINQEQQRVYEQLGDNLSRALTEGLFDSFKKGESFGRAMLRNLAAFGKTAFAQILQGFTTSALQRLLGGGGVAGGASALGGLSSLFSAPAQAAGGGSGGLLSSLSSIGDIFQKGNSALIGGIESLGAFLSTGTGGLGDIIGGALEQYSSQIANILPFAGVGLNLLQGNVKGALGSALGAALSFTPLGPVGGIIGSIVGGGLFGGKKQPPRTVTALPEVNEQFINTLTALTQGFGLDSNITANARYSGRSGGSGYGFLDASVNGTAINEGIRYKGAYGEATLKQFIDTVLVSSVKRAIESLDLSEGIKKFFTDLTKQEEIVATINGLVSLNAQLKTLPPVFDAIRTALDTTAFKISIEELQKQFSDTSVFTSLFYTAEEQFKIFTDQLTGQLTELNTALPKTRDEYRALIDGFKVTDEASSKLFGGLVALAPALDNYFKQIEAQKQQFAGLNSDFFSTSDDFISASIKAGQGKDFSREIGDISSVRRNIDPESNAVVQALVKAQADTRALLEAVAKAVQETARIQKIWNGDGLPETRVI